MYEKESEEKNRGKKKHVRKKYIITYKANIFYPPPLLSRLLI